MNLKPLGDRIVVKVVNHEEKNCMASCFLIPPRKSSPRAKSLLSAKSLRTARSSSSKGRRQIIFSTPEQK